MNNTYTGEKHHTVLAIDPMCRGFGYAVLEGPQTLVDWGLTTSRNKHSDRLLYSFKKLLAQYQPQVIVLRLLETKGSQNSTLIAELCANLSKCANVEMIPVKHYALDQVHELFARLGGRNKEEIADSLVEWFPQLTPYRPPYRAHGNCEDERINIFDAIALALTFYYYEEK